MAPDQNTRTQQQPTAQSGSVRRDASRPQASGGASRKPAPQQVPIGTYGRPSDPRPLNPWAKRGLIIWSCIGAAALIYLLGIVLNVLAMPVGILIWTVLLVFVLGWQVDALERRGLKRIFGTVIAYVGMFVVLAVVGTLMFSPFFNVGEQFQNLIQSLPGFVEQVVAFANSVSSRFAEMFNNPTVSDVMGSAQKELIAAASSIASESLGGVADMGSVTMNTLVCLGFALVVSFWIILEMPGLMREFHRLVPPRYRADADFFYRTVTRSFGGYVRATGLQCLIIALGCTIGFTIIGVPNAIAIGIIAGLLNVIPVVGPWLGGAVAALAAVFESPLVALLALAVAVVIQQVVYTFVSPKIMANSVDVHPAIVILSLMVGYAIGMQMSGLVGALVGMFLAIPFAAIAKAFFVYYFERNTGRRLASPDGVFFKAPSHSGGLDPELDAMGSPSRKPPARKPADASARKDAAQAPSAQTGRAQTPSDKRRR